jgi:hypothetical protein
MTMANSSANSSTETTNAAQGAKVPVTLKLVLFSRGNLARYFALKLRPPGRMCSLFRSAAVSARIPEGSPIK